MGQGAAAIVEHKVGGKWVYAHFVKYKMDNIRLWAWLDDSYTPAWETDQILGKLKAHPLARERMNTKFQASVEGRKWLRRWSLGHGWYTLKELFDDAMKDPIKMQLFGEFLDELKKICVNNDPSNYRLLFGFFP